MKMRKVWMVLSHNAGKVNKKKKTQLHNTAHTKVYIQVCRENVDTQTDTRKYK